MIGKGPIDPAPSRAATGAQKGRIKARNATRKSLRRTASNPPGSRQSPPLGMDLNSGEIQTVVWATGFRPDHSWLDLPVFDRKGRIRHDGGIVEAPGMYLMGIPFLRRRKSSLIDGAGDDARDLSAHLAAYLEGAAPRPASDPASDDRTSAVG